MNLLRFILIGLLRIAWFILTSPFVLLFDAAEFGAEMLGVRVKPGTGN